MKIRTLLDAFKKHPQLIVEQILPYNHKPARYTREDLLREFAIAVDSEGNVVGITDDFYNDSVAIVEESRNVVENHDINWAIEQLLVGNIVQRMGSNGSPAVTLCHDGERICNLTASETFGSVYKFTPEDWNSNEWRVRP